MNTLQDLLDQNQKDFRQTVTDYGLSLKKSYQLLDIQYTKGQLALLQEAKRLILENSEFKYVPFTDIAQQLEKSIQNMPDMSKNDSRTATGLNLTGINIKKKKKRLYNDEKSINSEESDNANFGSILQKFKLSS
jgi:hypothetical protein